MLLTTPPPPQAGEGCRLRQQRGQHDDVTRYATTNSRTHTHLDPLQVRRREQQRPRQLSLVDDTHDLVHRQQQLRGRGQPRRRVRVEVTDGFVEDASRHLNCQELGRLVVFWVEV